MYRRKNRPGWATVTAALRVAEAEALESLCRRRGWSIADAIRSIINPPTGHRRVNPAVDGLTFLIPERYGRLLAGIAGDRKEEAARAASMFRKFLPAEAPAAQRLAAEYEDLCRWLFGVLRDYDRLHEAKAESPTAAQDRDDEESHGPAPSGSDARPA